MFSTWLYSSVCTLDRAEAGEAMQAIQAVSQSRNATLDVTGALIWTGERYSQFIEGPAASVAALRQSILSDPRHRSALTLEASTAARRAFAGWWAVSSAGTSFFERELKRICEQAGTRAEDSARDLKALLMEFVRTTDR